MDIAQWMKRVLCKLSWLPSIHTHTHTYPKQINPKNKTGIRCILVTPVLGRTQEAPWVSLAVNLD